MQLLVTTRNAKRRMYVVFLWVSMTWCHSVPVLTPCLVKEHADWIKCLRPMADALARRIFLGSFWDSGQTQAQLEGEESGNLAGPKSLT